MGITKWVSLLAVLAVAAAGSSAQFGRQMGPRVQGVWNPQVGSGAVYQFEGRDGKSEFSFAVVGTETVAGKTGHWLETTFSQGRQGTAIIKNLMVLDGDKVGIKRMIMQPPGEGPIEFPVDMMMRMGGQGGATETSADIRDDSELVGEEDVTTPAGTFRCTHYRAKDKSWDAWISEKVPPYGLVKMNSGDGSMVLLRVLTGAKTQIKGTPVKFDMQMPPR